MVAIRPTAGGRPVKYPSHAPSASPARGMIVGDHTAELIERGQRARQGNLEHRAIAVRPAVRGCP